VTEDLSAQGRPDPRGGFDVSNAQTKLESLLWCIWHIKNRQKWNRIEKVVAPQSRGGQELKNQITEHYKGQFLNTQKKSLYVAILLLEFKDDL
jgi:phosphorylcholine metabolism protein LicD